MAVPANDEVTAADIARLAGVGRAAVSNWRRRHGDFPQPVGGPATSPTFALADVETWLRANGKQQSDEGNRAPSTASGPDHDLSDVVVSLIPAVRNGIVLDPACGAGQLLAAAAHRLGRGVFVAGQDANQVKVSAATDALTHFDTYIVVGSPMDSDGLADYRREADVVICLPPGRPPWQSDRPSLDMPWEFGPPSSIDSALAWLQVCFLYVKPGGHAILPMPYSASVRASGRRIRAELLRSGALRQVVALPERFDGQVSGPWQIWVLRRPVDRPTYTVRLVDLTGTAPDEIPGDAKRWQAVYDDESRTRDVASIELLDEDVLIIPARHIESPARDVSGDYARLRDHLAQAVSTLDAPLPVFGHSTEPVTWPTTTVAELVRGNVLQLVNKDDDLRVGDVIVAGGAHRFDASVVGQPLPPQPARATAEVVRCDTEQLDPYFLACFLRSETNRRQASGTQGGTFRLDLRRARIPRLPLAEQRRYGSAFRQLTTVTDRLEQVTAIASDAVQSAVYGLTSGGFVPDDPA